MWCNARVTAAGFYERTGSTVVTGLFDVPPIGRHVGMVTDLRSVRRPVAVCTP